MLSSDNETCPFNPVLTPKRARNLQSTDFSLGERRGLRPDRPPCVHKPPSAAEGARNHPAQGEPVPAGQR